MISLQPQLLVEAKWKSNALVDVAKETSTRLSDLFSTVDWSNKRVAVAVGSRGIDQIATVARAAIDWLKSRGADPFVVPAMGSHGGATPEGQVEVLASLGVTEKSVGAPIDASMETVELGRIEDGARVLTSRVAYQADSVLIINRIKPHTDFYSPEIGSGLRKMSVIGLGKAQGAAEFHREAARHGYEVSLKKISGIVLSKYRSAYGLALVEDAHHHLAHIEALTGGEIAVREPELMTKARAWMPTLPFKEIDLLIVDEMGKNISGAGMDTNIIERGIDGLPRPLRSADVRSIYVRSLTPESHGNAIGIGLADIVSGRLVAEMDKQATYTNALTAITPATARIPMHFSNDEDCLNAALRVAGTEPASAHIVRVRNTLSLDRFIATANYAAEISGRGDLEILKPPQEWGFTAEGDFDPALDLL